ncbi:prefoldin subunit beta [Candidatus Pacearchaeota archaeon]|nr:prefoldin subunit beta [Candidatus Pacearchaeota archaeon]
MIQQKIEELQLLEQNLQALLMQKQSHQMELNEILNALEELKHADDEVYRVLGGIMLRSDKKKLTSELEEKKKVLDLRVTSIEKQENLVNTQALTLRKEINSSMEKNSKEKR